MGRKLEKGIARIWSLGYESYTIVMNGIKSPRFPRDFLSISYHLFLGCISWCIVKKKCDLMCKIITLQVKQKHRQPLQLQGINGILTFSISCG